MYSFIPSVVVSCGSRFAKEPSSLCNSVSPFSMQASTTSTTFEIQSFATVRALEGASHQQSQPASIPKAFNSLQWRTTKANSVPSRSPRTGRRGAYIQSFIIHGPGRGKKSSRVTSVEGSSPILVMGGWRAYLEVHDACSNAAF